MMSNLWTRMAVKFVGVVAIAALLFVILFSGCWTSSKTNEVVVYASLDAEFSQPLLEEFEKETGIRVQLKTDVESTKTVGLVNQIIQEKDRPRCDVYWNNEVLHTIRLQQQGLLSPYESHAGVPFSSSFKSEDGTWHGLAGRARVLIVNTDIVDESEMPSSIYDLIDPKWKGKVGVAKPAFGTTATHAAVLFAAWGDNKAKQFFRDMRANAEIMGGNKQVAQAVASGRLAFGITDTDDAVIEIEQGFPVTIVFPDQDDDQMGTMMIPNTVTIVKDGPNTANAKQLIDYLLSPHIEEQLAAGPSAQIPLSPNVTATSRVVPAEPPRWMDVDYDKAATKWETTIQFIDETFSAN